MVGTICGIDPVGGQCFELVHPVYFSLVSELFGSSGVRLGFDELQDVDKDIVQTVIWFIEMASYVGRAFLFGRRGCLGPIRHVFYVKIVTLESVHQSELCLANILAPASSAGYHINEVVEPASDTLWDYVVFASCGADYMATMVQSGAVPAESVVADSVRIDPTQRFGWRGVS